MAVFKINKTKDYTVMSNYHLKDQNLSLKAKGLLSLMLSLPENWDYSVAGLKAICKEAINTINEILHELERNKYLKRNKIYKNGKISEWEYNIYENPDLYLKNEDIENQDIEKQDIENCVQLNTNKSIINKLNTNKEIYIGIFDTWNAQNVIKHKELNQEIEKVIDKLLKVYTEEDIKRSIEHYGIIYNDKDYYFNYKWSLLEFLKQKNAMPDFLDNGSKWLNYKENPKMNTFIHNNYSRTTLDNLITNLDKVEI